MSEIQKHIESCRAEDPLAQTMEACGNESDLQAALQPLLVETMPGYEPVPTTAPTSTIAELPNVLISIIRRVATKPLTILGERPAKQSLLGTLLDTWNAIRQRLSGNPSLGIPDRRADMTAHSLPTALALLNDRKITNGGSTTDGIPDGMSLARLINDPSIVTKLIDDNIGWTLNYNPVTKFANITLFKSNAQQIAFSVELASNMFTGALLRELDMPLLERAENTLQSSYQVCYHGVFAFTELERVNLPKLNYINGCLFRSCTLPDEVTLPELVTATRGLLDSVSGIKRISAPKLTTCNGYSYNPNVLANCPDLEYAYVPNVTSLSYYGTTGAGGTLQNMPKLEELHIGKVAFTSNSWNTVFLTGCGSLIKLVIYGDLNQNLYLNSWSPTLDSSNLQQFLTNFREFIALRLANRKETTALTLTLSAAVYNAVTGADSGWASLHTLAELGITTDDLTELEQELGITTATLYSTWLDTYTGANGIHWNVNKAN